MSEIHLVSVFVPLILSDNHNHYLKNITDGYPNSKGILLGLPMDLLNNFIGKCPPE